MPESMGETGRLTAADTLCERGRVVSCGAGDVDRPPPVLERSRPVGVSGRGIIMFGPCGGGHGSRMVESCDRLEEDLVDVA